MKIIEQKSCDDIKIIDQDAIEIVIESCGCAIPIDKKGAAELIKVLQEFIDEK